MMISRRSVLGALSTGTTLYGIATTTSRSARAAKPKKGSIRNLGHSLLSDPPGGFAEESIRADGQYAIVGSFLGTGGSFLVDISNPTDPTEVHHVPSPSTDTRHADVKFDHRDGLYYRSLEGGGEGVDVIDYGFGAASETDPSIIATMDAGETHNLVTHPEEPIVYTVNEHDETTPGLEVWDVSDPATPTLHGEAGPAGALHDVVVDPVRNFAHLAYIGPKAELDAYVILDTSDPWNPTEVGRFDYAGEPDYDEVDVGEEAFENCHYANYDPNRELAVVGDELGFGNPGGKHVFDIGWGVGSPSDPQPIGFTLSPNAEPMDEPDEAFDWTGHNFDIVPKGKTTMLVSGDYHEGAVVYDISDPTDPTATDQYLTDDDADEANPPLFPVGDAPMAWGVDYADQRDFTVVSDMVTGIYVLHFTPAATSSREWS